MELHTMGRTLTLMAAAVENREAAETTLVANVKSASGTYTLGNMYTFKGMPYCYDLYPSSSNSMCGRSGFLIHGGGCSGNPSEGCIVIESESTRYLIKSGATLKVIA
eukprot:gene19456-19878_t